MTIRLRILTIVLLVFSLIFAPHTRAHAASPWIVTTNSDDVSNTGSLRYAIQNAADDDTITFNADYTITLTSELTVSKNLTISGALHTITLDGNRATRIFNVSSGRLSLDNLTLIDGHPAADNFGGAINVQKFAELDVNNSTFSNNSASLFGGAIYVNDQGWAKVDLSIFRNNSAVYGGAIGFSQADLTVSRTLFTENYSLQDSNTMGGGVYGVSGNLTVTQSAFIANSMQDGGGLYVQSGNLVVGNSTFAKNSSTAGSGVFASGSVVILANNTFTLNSSGNPASPSTGFQAAFTGDGNISISASNNLFAGQIRGANCSAILGGESKNNLDDDGSCGAGEPSDILLGSLDYYGGSTPTVPLLPGSPAIGAGDVTTCQARPVQYTDQRSIPRARDTDACDIGAFETNGFSLIDASGTSQSMVVDAAFKEPLALTVTANNPSEPVIGGVVNFTTPVSGASATISGTTIGHGGKVSATAIANSISDENPYNVSASAAGASNTLIFNLTNAAALKTGFRVTPDKLTDDTNAIISFDGSGGVGAHSYDFHLDEAGWTHSNDPNVTVFLTDLTEGSHTFYARTIDSLGNVDSNEYTWTVDTTSPSVTLSSTTASATNNTPIPVTVVFSENVIGFEASDIAVTNGTLADFTGNGAIYNFNLSPANQGSITVDIAAGAAHDAIGHSSTAAAQLTRTFDSLAPTGVLSSSSRNPTNTTTIPITISFSEPVHGLTLDDLSVQNGAASDLVASGDSRYSADISPTADGQVTISLGAGVAQDSPGNDNLSITPLSITYDGTAPEVRLSQANDQEDPAYSLPLHFTAVFSEPIDTGSFVGDDFTVDTTAPGVPSIIITQIDPHDDTTFDVSVSGLTGSGALTLNLDPTKVRDLAGNAAIAFIPSDTTVTYSTTVPTVTSLSELEQGHSMGVSWKLTASVTSPIGIPVGEIVFRDGTTILGTCVLSNGVATFEIHHLAAGSHTLTAEYQGDTLYAPSSSNGVLIDAIGFLALPVILAP